MDYLARKELLEFYNRHLREFGDRPEAVRWTPEGQRLRYERFLRLASEIEGKRLLDFGCGKGDFYGFLLQKGVGVKYTGVDINENLIRLARQKYPGVEFLAMDIEETPLEETYDLVFVCGVFNLRVAEVSDMMKRVLKLLYSLTRDLLYLDCLSHYAKRDIQLHYVRPEELIRFTVENLSRRFTLHHGLIDDDMVLIVYRDSPGP